jgi:hypothetical protein
VLLDVVRGRGQLDCAGDHVAGVEPEIDLSQLAQADEEQPGDDEQRGRDRELRSHQRASQPPHPEPAVKVRRARALRVFNVEQPVQVSIR